MVKIKQKDFIGAVPIMPCLNSLWIMALRIYGEGRTQIPLNSSSTIGPLPRISVDRVYTDIKNCWKYQKYDGNMIFTDYWKVLVLMFLEMGNAVFSWAKKLMEVWYLLITGKFLFWTFRWWKIRSFSSQEVDGKMIFTGYWEVLVLNFSVMGNAVFFQPKRW